MKKGRFTVAEIKFITDNAHNATAEEIAKKLDRDPISVRIFLKTKLRMGSSMEEEMAFTLEDRPYWSELELQFSEGELELFKYHWARIITQFKDNVIPTEELQVVDLIKLELLMNRCLKVNKSGADQIVRMEEIINSQRRMEKELQDTEELYNLERQVASLRASQESLNRDYRELQTKKNGMLKDMRATRESRIKVIEESNQTFIGWISHLLKNPGIVKEYGREMEKFRLAADNERKRLSTNHLYQDNIVDKPLLNCDTVMEGD